MKTVFAIALGAYLSYRICRGELESRLKACRAQLVDSVDSRLKANGWNKKQRNELLKDL